jgi:hypothetical protein
VVPLKRFLVTRTFEPGSFKYSRKIKSVLLSKISICPQEKEVPTEQLENKKENKDLRMVGLYYN